MATPDLLLTLEMGVYRHREALLAYIAKHLPTELARHVDSHDIVQDVYLQAVATAGEWVSNGDETLLRGLLTLTRSRIVDLMRSFRAAKRGGQRFQEPDDSSAELLFAQMLLYERTPSESAMSHEVHELVTAAMELLPDEQAYALRLRYFSGLPLQEVGHCMSRTAEAAEQLCRRAVRQLRETLTPPAIKT